jgi:hypothetical protein
MSLELFVCMVIVVFCIMKGPDGIPGPARPPPSEMILIDRILMGTIILLTLLFLVYLRKSEGPAEGAIN